ncbi:MAG TPA: tRNA-dihydrouridine synthase family protein [Candidatus Nanoarchaeia archaeon]|nr:tRNA-dihydrouridine synthase family protein [Candidatus Nanoarchaeia archaeon]
MYNKKFSKTRYILAPMEEINDIAFRILCKRGGVGLTYTGLINPLTKQKIFLKDRPILQLFSPEKKGSEGVRKFVKKHDKEVSGWELNLGCPSKNARKQKFGVYLKDLEVIEEVLSEIRKNTKKPASIKIRKTNWEWTLKLIKIAEKYCDAIAIHPRTKEQGYSGKPDIKFAEKIKQKTFLPIIYSGDVNEKNNKNLLEKFDYLMVGRAAIGRPEIFSKLKNEKPPKNISFKDYFKLAKKYNLPYRQIKFQAMNFTKTKRGARKLRLEIFKCRTTKQLEKIIDKIS